MNEHHPECGCQEYQKVTRRQFLGTGSAAVLAATAPAWLPKVVFAEDDFDRDVLVFIYLRGGCDGLSMCVPYAEDRYYALRPTIAIPRPDSGDPNHAIDLNGFFGFPPAMSPLMTAYNAGHLCVIQASGIIEGNRSHFDNQEFSEKGAWDSHLDTGWLARHLMTIPPLIPSPILRAAGIGAISLPTSLLGAGLSLPIQNPSTFGLKGAASTKALRLQYLDYLYDLVGDPLHAAAINTQNTLAMLGAINFTGYVPAGGAVYPSSGFGNSLKSSAALIREEVGVEAITIDLGGWDTHSDQDPVDGYMSTVMGSLAAGLAAFHLDLASAGMNRVTTIVMSEFGRNVAENASAGTDHGYGNVMFVMGEHISGGQVMTQWPGLDPGELYQGQDLAITIDYRDILAEVVQQRLGNNQLSQIFPDFTPNFQGVTISDPPPVMAMRHLETIPVPEQVPMYDFENAGSLPDLAPPPPEVFNKIMNMNQNRRKPPRSSAY
ncbi:MAG: hypothetical protein HJJLKODD_01073 [Phycisphaerae bacterium]|nr:hypothetical protein [Phycisphaerae bacterium]